jgi:hypothetical protein
MSTALATPLYATVKGSAKIHVLRSTTPRPFNDEVSTYCSRSIRVYNYMDEDGYNLERNCKQCTRAHMEAQGNELRVVYLAALNEARDAGMEYDEAMAWADLAMVDA